MKDRIGFMQGRLSKIVNGKIQAFPQECWEHEFEYANDIDIRVMEWTLDQENLKQNPLMMEEGRRRIKFLSEKFNLKIPSLTGDCFMQAPFWKAEKTKAKFLQKDFIDVVNASSNLGIKYIVVPVVDNGSIETQKQSSYLAAFLNDQIELFKKNNIKIIFELELTPSDVGKFIEKYTSEIFGINYDIGNSASMGYDPIEEINIYGDRILNVHVKDRLLGGSTVELGRGNADFDKVFSLFKKINYQGNFILQTARARDNEHSELISKYRNMIISWLKEFN